MRRVEKSSHSTTIRLDLMINNPAFLIISFAFVMWLVRLLVERVRSRSSSEANTLITWLATTEFGGW
jgi:hypothetical protein